MGAMLPERFAIGLTPLPTAARVARQRSALKMRIISSVVSLAFLLGILFLFDHGWSTGTVTALLLLWVASTAVWMVMSIVGLHRAKKDLASISHGDALRIDAAGIEFLHPTSVRADWSDISALRIIGGQRGAGPRLTMETDGQRVAAIPLSFMDVTPSAIDSATSARSLGRVRVDVSGLDKMF